MFLFGRDETSFYTKSYTVITAQCRCRELHGFYRKCTLHVSSYARTFPEQLFHSTDSKSQHKYLRQLLKLLFVCLYFNRVLTGDANYPSRYVLLIAKLVSCSICFFFSRPFSTDRVENIEQK